MRIVISAMLLWMVAAGSALAAGGGGGGPSTGSIGSAPAARSPDEIAMAAYKSGVKQIEKANTAKNPAKAYAKARGYFAKATAKRPGMYEAWNYLGFSERKLGNYPAALTAYDRALELNPRYGEAIEYRGEAYLGLNHIDDAKSAYMLLFGAARPLADQLMAAMQVWVAARRADPAGLSAGDLDGFAQWVDERAQLAKQTASLGIGTAEQAW